MYANTHLFYTVKKLKNSFSGLDLLGSVLPDIALMKIIGWDDLHDKQTIERFKEFIRKTHPDFVNLARGLHAHFLLDEITHKQYQGDIGYAYKSLTPGLIQLVAKAFEIEDQTLAKTVAHNIIEIGVDAFVLEENPDLLKIFAKEIENIDRGVVAELLSSFFNLNNNRVKSALDQYISMIIEYDTREVNDCVELCDEISMLLFEKPVVKSEAEQCVLTARSLVADTYQEFLEFALSEGELND